MSHKYKLKYDLNLDAGEFSKEEVQKEKKAGCDALFFASILFPEDGSYSAYFHSIDGRNEGKELDDNEWFKIWMSLASRLQRSETLSEGKKRIAEATMALIQSEIIGQDKL